MSKPKSKRQQMREKQRRKKMRSRLIWGAIVVAGLALIGLFVWQGARPLVGVEVEFPENYSQHLEEGQEPGPFLSNPPSVGRHYGRALEAGFYDENSPQAQIEYPEGYIGHNIEHGHVIFWYNCDLLSESECNTLKDEIKAVMDDFDGVKLVAFPWNKIDVPVAMTSWGRIQEFETFDSRLAAAFVRTNRNRSPESNAP